METHLIRTMAVDLLGPGKARVRFAIERGEGALEAPGADYEAVSIAVLVENFGDAPIPALQVMALRRAIAWLGEAQSASRDALHNLQR